MNVMNIIALKWLGTAVLILGISINSLGFYPLGPCILVLGSAIWLVVSIAWKEPSMIITNSVMVLAGVIGLLIKL